jgi:hypothetical protein
MSQNDSAGVFLVLMSGSLDSGSCGEPVILATAEIFVGVVLVLEEHAAAADRLGLLCFVEVIASPTEIVAAAIVPSHWTP